MNLLVGAVAVFLLYKLVYYIFGRFGRKSKLSLWGKYSFGDCDIYVLSFKNGVARNKHTLLQGLESLGFVFAQENDMLRLAELGLPPGLSFSSEVTEGKIVTIHTFAQGSFETEISHSLPFSSMDLYVAVDLVYVTDKKRSETLQAGPKLSAAG